MTLTYERGNVRFVAGLLWFLGTAGAANNSPLTTALIPPFVASVLLAAWGLSRSENGPHLPALVRAWEERVSRSGKRRRVVYQRAARRA